MSPPLSARYPVNFGWQVHLPLCLSFRSLQSVWVPRKGGLGEQLLSLAPPLLSTSVPEWLTCTWHLRASCLHYSC